MSIETTKGNQVFNFRNTPETWVVINEMRRNLQKGYTLHVRGRGTRKPSEIADGRSYRDYIPLKKAEWLAVYVRNNGWKMAIDKKDSPDGQIEKLKVLLGKANMETCVALAERNKANQEVETIKAKLKAFEDKEQKDKEFFIMKVPKAGVGVTVKFDLD